MTSLRLSCRSLLVSRLGPSYAPPPSHTPTTSPLPPLPPRLPNPASPRCSPEPRVLPRWRSPSPTATRRVLASSVASLPSSPRRSHPHRRSRRSSPVATSSSTHTTRSTTVDSPRCHPPAPRWARTGRWCAPRSRCARRRTQGSSRWSALGSLSRTPCCRRTTAQVHPCACGTTSWCPTEAAGEEATPTTPLAHLFAHGSKVSTSPLCGYRRRDPRARPRVPRTHPS